MLNEDKTILKHTFPGHEIDNLYNCFAKYSLGSEILWKGSCSFLPANISSENAV